MLVNGQHRNKSDLVFVEQHVGDAALDFVDACAVRANELPLDYLPLQQKEVKVGEHLLVVEHGFFESLGQVDAPVQLKIETRQNQNLRRQVNLLCNLLRQLSV